MSTVPTSSCSTCIRTTPNATRCSGGYEQTPETRDIPLVTVSAEATPGKIERFIAAGARVYLIKPLDVKAVP